MRWRGWDLLAARTALFLAMATIAAACGLSLSGASDAPDATPGDATSADAAIADVGPDATIDGGGVTTTDGAIVPTDATALDAPSTSDVAAPCENSPTNCGVSGACTTCSAAAQGHTCVLVAGVQMCGCGGAADCPPQTACDTTSHVCGAACAGGLTCAGGCCDGTQCQVGTGNGACGQTGAMCQACGGATPTCGASGGCTGACGSAGDGTCGGATCCGGGTCTTTSDSACGAPGATCVDCATAPTGDKCVVIATIPTCGCGGPNTPTDCPPAMACRNNQCTTSCDGQHPCNGGCCSSADNGACVAACNAPATCTGNVCI